MKHVRKIIEKFKGWSTGILAKILVKVIGILCKPTKNGDENMQSFLARDDRGSVAQVGSYLTMDSITLTTGQTMVAADTGMYRVKSYGNANWISRFTLEHDRISTITLSNTQISGGDGDYVWNGVDKWVLTSTNFILYNNLLKNYAIIIDNDGAWKLSGPAGMNPKSTGWVYDAYHGTPEGVVSLTYGDYVKTPSANVGMYMANGDEVTMLLYKGDAIGTGGPGSINITPIGR